MESGLMRSIPDSVEAIPHELNEAGRTGVLPEESVAMPKSKSAGRIETPGLRNLGVLLVGEGNPTDGVGNGGATTSGPKDGTSTGDAASQNSPGPAIKGRNKRGLSSGHMKGVGVAGDNDLLPFTNIPGEAKESPSMMAVRAGAGGPDSVGSRPNSRQGPPLCSAMHPQSGSTLSTHCSDAHTGRKRTGSDKCAPG